MSLTAKAPAADGSSLLVCSNVASHAMAPYTTRRNASLEIPLWSASDAAKPLIARADNQVFIG
ncbi:hypothetical protein MKK88_22980 [Methylobacterium sp. E-005]|uniref:hypothetical protein n=1 Tax=Methylobacterium sp. E-005 TaxID=2836549 RepID=UPI001FB8F3C9|nr:hypothetical protein [Methylobacterium sp. E-005]MCJ2088820.1 hypothetical protein [Methylobacterium sp. E-005]